jgi:hypothetical protein
MAAFPNGFAAMTDLYLLTVLGVLLVSMGTAVIAVLADS